jgi:hypothetical protein
MRVTFEGVCGWPGLNQPLSTQPISLFYKTKLAINDKQLFIDILVAYLPGSYIGVSAPALAQR